MLKLKSVDSSSQNYSYDVFLSFRGEDTRKSFTDHLYKALQDEGLITFRDDEEIERGESIKSELENGIQQSRSWIVVFSENYAFSSWCLDELVMILKCRNESKRLLLPIFYHVDPSDIRKQSGCLCEAFSRHEEKFKREVNDTKRKDLMEKIKQWRTALTELANLGGMHLQNLTNGYESEFILKIVSVIKDKVTRNNILSITPHLVGINDSLHAINLWLRDGSANLEVFALYGIGGVGKTTIAKYVYNTSFQLFEGGSFLENIREYSERPDGLLCLQRQLLSDISKGKTPAVNNLNDGIHKIRRALHGRKLLIVLDDVDQSEQLDAIFGMREWFYHGSKIMLTTRNVHLLNAHKHCKRYAVDTMNVSNSLELFSWHAFRDSHPPECYIEQSEKILKQCQGLPLALEVLGASLHGKMRAVWTSAIQKLETFTHSKLQKILKISYESLPDDHDRELFLELACFFNGEAKSSVVVILDACKYYTTIGVDNLVDRCLLKIDTYGKLRMHQLIESMGREIVRQQSPKDPGEWSRLWHYRDSVEILEDETGTRAIEGLALDMDMTNAYQTELSTKAFSMMHKLRLLKLNKVQLRGGYRDFPKKLKWLCWHGYTQRSLPDDFPLSSLVAIDMQNSKLQKLVQGNMCLGSLKILNLSHCHCVVESPNFSQLRVLEQLILEGCASLVEINESIQMAEGLLIMNLKDCINLRKLSKNLGMLKLLETLIISGCSNLSTLPAAMKEMESLKVFQADGLDFGNSSFVIEEYVSWPIYFWGWVSKRNLGSQLLLSSLPFKSIRRLSLVNCNLHDNAFPKDFIAAPSLKYLDLSNNPIRFLPECFEGVKMLKRLTLRYCNQLQALENLPNIDSLHVTDCPLLEKIRCKEGASLISVASPWRCKKLLEMEKSFKVVPLEKMDSEMIKNCGIDDVESKKRIQIRLYNKSTFTETSCPIQAQ
ncbi:disease resistance protein RPV1-like isoform X3 [Daucus carota subsp. sativus]|uniref:disease resistance protein RPV1-like isoform X3 n=1 Tax=Daucus carota subsp. sativus TaxID=79200 RepID=UPI003083C74B